MKILFDHQAFTFQRFGGISNSFTELINHLPSGIDYEISIEKTSNIHLNKIPKYSNISAALINYHSFLPHSNFRGKKKLYTSFNNLFNFLPSEENLNLKKSISKLLKHDFDIFHPTFFDDYFLQYLKNKPFVLTIHDMMPERFPEYYKQNDIQIIAKRKLAQRASAIIAVSEHTKKDIVNILDIPKEKITVIYHGGPDIEIISDKPLINSPYFLYVGTRNAYKNFTQTIIDFQAVNKFHKDISLLCTGEAFSDKETELIKRLNLEHHVRQISASDIELKNLYSNALAFIYPSLYEGFGMPILESYAYGCPILINNKSCFPEIAQDAALYFNSDSSGSNLAQAMEKVIYMSKEERENQIQKGYKRLGDFSWSKSAKKLSDLYYSIL